MIFGNHQAFKHSLLEKYKPIARIILSHHNQKKSNIENQEYLKSLNYAIIKEKSLINDILSNPKLEILVQKNTARAFKLKILKVKNRQFIYLKKRNKIFLIEDKNETIENPINYTILVFIIIFIALVLSFILTIKKLIPLKILKDKVSILGDEDFDFDFKNIDKKDEVSLLAIEFKNTAKKLKNIKEARNVFIRNIMHELKTPITKGRFLTQIPRNEQNDEKLKKVFIRLESLINEFASIEELISSHKNIEKNFYFLDDIVDNAKDILMIEDEKIVSLYKNKKLQVNFKLFSIAIKNLIDNAIKYSKDKKVIIENEDEDIIFKNNGEKLKYDLEKYYEPFFANEDKAKNSFGLGLYIVNHILKANNYILDYKYENGINIFTCKKI